jgi:LemA protein
LKKPIIMTDTSPSPRSSSRPRWLVPVAAILIIAFLIYRFFAGAYNNMVTYDEATNKFEQETLTQVIEARAKATSINIDPSNISPEQFAQFQQAQDQLSGALSRLLVTVERYPELKANTNFLELQAELAGTENRINVARNDYNAAVQAYNTYVRRFPQNMLAGMFGFERRSMFEAAAGSDVAPTVEF